jgi:hypothetical protein
MHQVGQAPKWQKDITPGSTALHSMTNRRPASELLITQTWMWALKWWFCIASTYFLFTIASLISIGLGVFAIPGGSSFLYASLAAPNIFLITTGGYLFSPFLVVRSGFSRSNSRTPALDGRFESTNQSDGKGCSTVVQALDDSWG